MAIDFSIVREAIPPLLEGLRVTALVSAIGIPLGVVAGIVAAYAAQSRTSRCRTSSWCATFRI
jgi:polar amino acid transport system permease protein